MKCEILIIFFGIMHIINCALLFPKNKTLILQHDLSKECVSQIRNMSTLTFLQMFDASTKIPNGLIGYSFYDFGNFDECYYLETEEMFGKYCLGTLALSYFKNIIQNFTIQSINKPIPLHPIDDDILNKIQYHFAVCIPNKCKVSEIIKSGQFDENFCYTKNNSPEFTTGAILTTILIALFLSLVILSTLYDIYGIYTRQNTNILLLSFSAISNGQKLLKSSNNQNQLLCLNGIRAISMLWVIIGHNFSLANTGPLTNTIDAINFPRKLQNMWVMSATVSVDTFFLLGGLVTVYTYLNSLDFGIKFNLFQYYLHRFMRLSPAFAISCLVYANLLIHFGVAPLWNYIIPTLVEPCYKYWYASFFYFSNYSHGGCVPQSWYLSVDMQLFLLSPIILIPLKKWKKSTLTVLSFLVFLGSLIPFIIGYVYELNAFYLMNNDYTIYYYIQTHCRFGPYVIGMLFGYFIYDYKKKNLRIQLQPIMVFSLWVLVIGGLLACIWAPYTASQEEYNKLSSSLMLAFHRQSWSFLVGSMIYLCVIGYGGPVDMLLSHAVFQFLAKLSYSMYLVHYAVISLRYYGMKNTFYFSNYFIITTFWGDFFTTLAVSTVLCLTCESPIIVLEKYLFRRQRR